MKRLYIGIVITLVVASAALWACGGSDNKDNGNTPEATSAMTAEPTSASSDTPSSSDGDTSAQLNDLVSKAKLKEAKVAYDFSSSAGGTESTGTVTLYSKPPASSRIDFDFSGSTGTIISADGKTYICTSGACIDSPVGAQALPFATYFQNPDQLTGLVGSDGVNHSSKTIAGEDADCYGGTAASGGSEVCFSNDGILLSIHSGSAGAAFDLTATSVGSSVADSDFDLPYPAQ